jgi:predicted RNA-binding Zn ribbon-like protein
MTSQEDSMVTRRYDDRMPSPWTGDLESKPAPGRLRLVQAFINTLDRETGQDRLAEPADAAPWMAENGLLGDDATLGANDLQTASEVREALRALVLSNSGGPPPAAARLAPLRQLAATGRALATVSGDGRVELTPQGHAMPARLFELLLIVKDAQDDGTWGHLKACANAECQWAFYDRSRNHGGTWCEMATCGNKLKNREFRARRRG